MQLMEPIIWAIILVALGLVVIVLELFVPSAGVLGIIAAILLISGIIVGFLQSIEAGTIILVVTVLLLPVIFAGLIKIWPSTPIGKLILIGRTNADDVLPQGEYYEGLKNLIGEKGVARTKMLPSGIVAIGDKTYDAVCDGFAIEPGQPVKVTAVRTNRVFVQPYDPADDQPTKFESNDILGQPIEDLGLESLDETNR